MWKTTWFVLFSTRKSVNIQLNCYPAISYARVFHPLFVSQTACNPRSQPRLRCYHGNLCRIVYDIAIGQHYGIKTYMYKW
jgi:hypothetical protein